MIVQPTLEQTRRVNRKRTYSGPGFGPRSFECLGMGMGLGLGVSASGSGATLTSILAGVPLAWMFDVSAAGTGTSPTGNGNTLSSGTTLQTLKDQSGNGVDWTSQLAVQTYSATGGPNGNAMCTTNGNSFLRAPYAAPAPGTTPSFTFLICKINAYTLNGALYSANNAQQIAGSVTSGKYTARNLTASAEVAAAAGTWTCVYMQLQNTTADILRMGSAQTTGTALGNASGTLYNYLGVDATFLDASYAFGFKTIGALTGPQISAIVSMYSSGRFSGVQF